MFTTGSLSGHPRGDVGRTGRAGSWAAPSLAVTRPHRGQQPFAPSCVCGRLRVALRVARAGVRPGPGGSAGRSRALAPVVPSEPRPAPLVAAGPGLGGARACFCSAMGQGTKSKVLAVPWGGAGARDLRVCAAAPAPRGPWGPRGTVGCVWGACRAGPALASPQPRAEPSPCLRPARLSCPCLVKSLRVRHGCAHTSSKRQECPHNGVNKSRQSPSFHMSRNLGVSGSLWL